MLQKPEFEKNDFLWRLATTVTVVSGLISALVFLLLIVNYLQIRNTDPINDLFLTELREDYAAAPERSEELAVQIRQLDLLRRKAFFTSQEHLRIGVILLLVSVSVFLVMFKNMARWRPERPQLPETPTAEVEWLSYGHSRTLIVWAAVLMLGVGLITSILTESNLTRVAAEGGAEAPEPVVIEYPTWEAMQLNWPSFRGPGSYGVAHFTNAPIAWDVESGEGIRWKVKVPLPGVNSPVVWGNRLYLSGADETTREVYCYDTETGDLLWQRALERFPGTPAEAPRVTQDTGQAAPTMAAHGSQVFVMFPNGDVAAFDSEGNPQWGKNLGVPSNHYGHSSSLIAYDGFVYVQYDDSDRPRVLALDAATGKQSWVAFREEISWASPIIAPTPLGMQLILNSTYHVEGYNPLSGQLLWSHEILGGEVAPSPAYSNGIVFSANDMAMGGAIQIGGAEGGAEEEAVSKIIWEWKDELPETSSPVGDGERFYFATSVGEIISLDATTGEQVWLHEFDDGFDSSPILVGDRIYVLDREGTMHIVRAGAEFEDIASISMGEETFATPAFMDGRIYLRTKDHLMCIEQLND